MTLNYSVQASLDGYTADASGRFDWAAPSEEVHAFVGELERGVGTYLYGRRIYDVMSAWETMGGEGAPEVIRDFATLWRAADKVVYSQTLRTVSTPRTRLEPTFDPEAVRRLVASSDRDVSVGGPGLAAAALRAGLVTDLHLLVVPVVVGGGTRWLPDDLRLSLDLVSTRRFANGTVHLHHRVRASDPHPA